jgi:hypothetical protein
MRVALLLSGGLGENNESYNSIHKNIIETLNPDIFFSYGWDSAILNENDFVNQWKPTAYYYGKFPAIIEPNIRTLERYDKHPETNINSLEKMYWGIYSANRLKSKYEQENGFKYDFVIRCRPDLVIYNPLELKSNDMFIPIGWDHRGGYNDTFAYGSSEQMDFYSNLYNKLSTYAQYNKIHPESFLKIHLSSSPYGIMRWYYPMRLRDMEIHKLEYRAK